MTKEVMVLIDGKPCAAEEGEPLLGVALRNGIEIPHLCYEESLKPYGACRLCLVEVLEGEKKGIETSCTLMCGEGLSVVTETEDISQHRRILFELYLAEAPGSEKLKKEAAKYGVFSTRFRQKRGDNDPLNNSCVMCGLCVRVCSEAMGVGAIGFIGRGFNVRVNTPYFEKSDVCMGCKACVEVCPTGAISFRDVSDVRIMESWSDTSIKMRRCEACGKYFVPQPLWDVTFGRFYYSDKEEKIRELCPDCRRKLGSAKVTSILEGRVDSHAG